MADNKKYYWLKLKDDFFAQKEIKKLRKVAGGDTYTIIYLKLQLLSIKNDGKLFFEGIEDNFIDEMALTLDEELENVKITLMFLHKHGLIEELKNDEYFLPKVCESIGSESSSAERVRRHRENKKALLCNNDVTISNLIETKCNTEKEKEKEKEKDKDKKKRIGEVDDFFESVWSLYPNKLGKTKVSQKSKKELMKLGFDTIKKTIEKYSSVKPEWKQYQHGSTFFNGGYVDYLESNYSEVADRSPYRQYDPFTDTYLD